MVCVTTDLDTCLSHWALRTPPFPPQSLHAMTWSLGHMSTAWSSPRKQKMVCLNQSPPPQKRHFWKAGIIWKVYKMKMEKLKNITWLNSPEWKRTQIQTGRVIQMPNTSDKNRTRAMIDCRSMIKIFADFQKKKIHRKN